ncbi:MAG: ribonuclease H family protein [Gemmatimonadota bacterium]
MDNPAVHIHADESCLGNQNVNQARPGGAAGLVEFWQRRKWLRRDYWISEPATTNNKMAIRSAIVGLSLLKKPCRVIFVSDSQYLIRGMTEWVAGWARSGWKRKTGALENVDLWRELVDVAQPHDVEWKWIKGHAGHAQNEYANHLATRAAKEQNQSGGLIESKFVAWLDTQREKYDRYLDFDHTAAQESAD